MKQMDQQLKERLVGAAVLVILGMLLIPSLLNGPPDDQPVQVGVELPAANREGKPSQTIRIDVPADKPGAGSITRQPEMPAAARPEQAKPEPVKSEPKASEPAPAHSGSGGETSRASAANPPAPEVRPEEPAKPSATVGGWAVQLGSFSNQENADRLSRELLKRGYQAFVDRAVQGGRTWYRVRVGPVPGREEAEALATRLSASGHSGQVVSNGG